MSSRARRAVVTVASPLLLGMLKLRTKITRQERARTIILNDRNQVFLVHEVASNRWSLPGGGIEKGETPVAAASREIKEEIGITVETQSLKSLGVLRKPEATIDYVAHIFVLTDAGAEVANANLNKRELIDSAWFDLDKLPNGISKVTRAAFELLSKTQSI